MQGGPFILWQDVCVGDSLLFEYHQRKRKVKNRFPKQLALVKHPNILILLYKEEEASSFNIPPSFSSRYVHMARRGENHDDGITVPDFGGWDHQVDVTYYSGIFSKARAKRKHTRKESPVFRRKFDEARNHEHHIMSTFCKEDACIFQPSLPPRASPPIYHKDDSNTCLQRLKQFLKKLTRCFRP